MRLSESHNSDGLGPLGDGVLSELVGEDQADGGLNFPGRDRRALVVVGEFQGLDGDAFQDLVDKRVYNSTLALTKKMVKICIFNIYI
ncbi:hypothetical protein L596_024398 [Steinernema carpocapsae]|uniref:Uncharacterized protein n=1 Tax=Steinernema carpocapsae TaxID=34508 RepID=A0A4U5MGM2_STECR|nr:hypothetical protein L596_024398 [Steinernema carpocapsae]